MARKSVDLARIVGQKALLTSPTRKFFLVEKVDLAGSNVDGPLTHSTLRPIKIQIVEWRASTHAQATNEEQAAIADAGSISDQKLSGSCKENVDPD